MDRVYILSLIRFKICNPFFIGPLISVIRFVYIVAEKYYRRAILWHRPRYIKQDNRVDKIEMCCSICNALGPAHRELQSVGRREKGCSLTFVIGENLDGI